MMSWKTYLARAAIGSAMVGVAVFAGVRLAVADPGGPTRDGLTFAGVLRERAGSTGNTLTFVFRKGTAAMSACTATTLPFAIDANGAFSVQVPLGGCADPRGLFDGDSVVYDVLLNGGATPIASDVAVTPVPYARFADQVGTNNDCPVGYVIAGRSPYVICQRRIDPTDERSTYDEIVKVGLGTSAFWIDRYEATIWSDLRGTGAPWGSVAQDYPAGFPGNGQWHRLAGGGRGAEPYALSRGGAWRPSRYVTWFQAQAACRNVGKRLASGEEWLAAATGSYDFNDSVSDGADGRCVMGGGVAAQITRVRCQSIFGAQDMIGNLAEWTADWFAATGTGATRAPPVANWGPTYGADYTTNIASFVDRGDSVIGGLPAAALRGGSWNMGSNSGIFALDLNNGPTFSDANTGFRCVTPR